MSQIQKVLLVVSALAFLVAIYSGLVRPVFGIPAESFSRASNNLALIAIGLAVCWKRDSTPGS